MISPDQTYSFDLTTFLLHLKHAGFHIGIDTHLNLQKVLAQLPPDYNVEDLQSILLPIICKSPKQQITFKLTFQQFLRQEELKKDESQDFTRQDANQYLWELFKEQRKKELYTLSQLWKRILTRLKSWISRQSKQITVAKPVHGLAPNRYRDLFAPTIPIKLSDVLTQSIAHLRTREPLGVQKLDIKKTVIKSVKNLGAFSPVYTDFTRYTEYLILIQADNRNDHKAQLYDSIYQEMHYRNIPAVRYFFRTSPRHCYDFNQDTEIALSDLVHHHNNAVLLVFANLNSFLEPRHNQPFEWVAQLTAFPIRCLFLRNRLIFGTTMKIVF